MAGLMNLTCVKDRTIRSIFRFFIQKYLGQFLKNPAADLNQLVVDLSKGTGSLHQVELNEEYLNERLKEFGSPVVIIKGFIEEIKIIIPWMKMFTESVIIDFVGLQLTVELLDQCPEDVGDVFESMFSMSNSTSSLLASEYFKDHTTAAPVEPIEEDVGKTEPIECMSYVVKLIEAILKNIKVNIINTMISLEHIPKDSQVGTKLELKIARCAYLDQSATASQNNNPNENEKQFSQEAAITMKNFQLFGVKLYCKELGAESQRTPSKESSLTRIDSYTESAEFTNLMSGFPSAATNLPVDNGRGKQASGDDKEEDPIKSESPCSILILEFGSPIDIKVKIRLNDEITAPKFEVDCLIGSCNIHLTPKLVHHLIDVIDGFSTVAQGSSNGSNDKHRIVNKRMQAEDYEKVRQDLQRLSSQNPKFTEKGFSKPHVEGNGMQTFDESDEEDVMYLSLDGGNRLSDLSSLENSMTSSATGRESVMSNTTCNSSSYSKKPCNKRNPSTQNKSKLREQTTEELSSDLKVFKFTLSSFSLVIHHNDPSHTTSDGQGSPSSSSEKTREMADDYFQKIFPVSVAAVSTSEGLVGLRQKYSEACPHDHLGLLCKSITVEVKQQKTSYVNSVSVDVDIGLVDFVEVLFQGKSVTDSSLGFHFELENLPIYTELLVFDYDELPKVSPKKAMYSSMQMTSPCVRAHVKTTKNLFQNYLRRGVSSPRVDVNIELTSCRSEVDITIVDRIHSLFHPQPSPKNTGSVYMSSMYQTTVESHQALFSQALNEDVASSDMRVDFQLTIDLLKLDIRFPKLDLRSHRVEKPWFQRSLQPEHLLLELGNAKFNSCFDSSATATILELTCKYGLGSFQMNQKPPLLLFRIGSESVYDEEEGFNWPRLVLKMFPISHSILERREEEDDSPNEGLGDTINGECPMLNKADCAPFSSRNILYDNQVLVTPGDRQDMLNFQDKVANNTRLMIELTLPELDAFIPDHETLEVLYNRVLNDFVLWEPAAPMPSDKLSNGTGLQFGADLMQRVEYSACQSGYYDSSSDSEQDCYSNQKHKVTQEQLQQQSKMCISLNIGKGKLVAHMSTMAEDKTINKSSHSEFAVDLEDLCFLTVTGYEGKPEVQFLCLQLQRGILYHNESVPTELFSPDLDSVISRGFGHLKPTIYLSDREVVTKLGGRMKHDDIPQDMISLTVQITTEFPSSRLYKMALGVRESTLMHRMVESGQSWIEQILSFLELLDFEIPGYCPPNIVHEMNLYLWGCSVDYRPLYLKYAALLTFKSFSISRTLNSETTSSLLRLLIDDATLCISDKKHSKSKKVDLSKDYVCVADLAAFELNYRESKKTLPQVDFQVTSNMLNIRTCSDSFTAMALLINYIAQSGDLVPPAEQDTGNLKRDYRSTSTESISSTRSSSPQLSQAYVDQLPDILADAMMEPESNPPEEKPCSGPTQVVYFKSPSTPSSDFSLPFGQDFNSSDLIDFEDEEFCIIDEPAYGIKPKKGNADLLFEEPLDLKNTIDSSSPDKADGYKTHGHFPAAPDHFPAPVSAYTVNEMSIVWSMYGGRDFESSPPGKTSQGSPKTTHKRTKSAPPGKVAWHTQGGTNRDLNTMMELRINKVRFQYHIYPTNAIQASRLILTIQEYEIHDRLFCSNIRKFLYLYSSKYLPQRTGGNMLVIRNLSTRTMEQPLKTENELSIFFQHLKINVDQDSYQFLEIFFTEINMQTPEPGDSKSQKSDRPSSRSSTPASLSSTPRHAPPVMGLDQGPLIPIPPMSDSVESSEMLMRFDDMADALEGTCDMYEKNPNPVSENGETDNQSMGPYFKSVKFISDVIIVVDYTGKQRVDLEKGTLRGILSGFAQLNGSQLKLKRFHKYGILGLGRVAEFALNEWINDIRKNQLGSLVCGVGPMQSFVQLFQGCKDLVWLPVEQYRRDGRIVRGLQRGAHSFMTCTAMSTLELTNKLVQTVQYAAEAAHDVVSPGPSIRHRKKHSKRKLRGYGHPADLREGMANAYQIVTQGVHGTASEFYLVAIKEHEQKGISGAIGGVLRQIPSTVIEPVIIATEATSNVLGGMRNQLLPEKKKDDEEKWKPEEH